MISLKIKEKGHLIEIPGISPFRTPATINISKIAIRTVIGYLQASGIVDYEIIATSSDGISDVYKKEDLTLKKKKENFYKKNIENRFDRLEKIIMKLYTREKKGNEEINKEQITKKLDKLEKLSEELLKNKTNIIYKDSKERIVDEDDNYSFIPEVDIDNLKLTSSSVKSLKQDQTDDIDDAANSLSELLGGKK